jgi:thiol-disulfide isomerase/thioredoxin
MATFAAAACDRQTSVPEQANLATGAAVTSDEVSPGETAPVRPAGAVDRSHKGEASPSVSFLDPAGKTVSLADFRGRPVLLNLWATWCAPCVKEMPSLDAAAASAGSTLRVLAVSQDMQRDKVQPFFTDRKLTHLTAYADPELGLSLAYKANLPMTVLLDAGGRELWRVSGAMDWTGTEARALIAEAGA